MILSNIEILRCLNEGLFSIRPLKGTNPNEHPFNTTAIDLHLSKEIRIPHGKNPVQIDLKKSGVAGYIKQNSDLHTITDLQPLTLKPGKFILAQTLEVVDFPLNKSGMNYSARVEGKSSLARCGILIHFTAPTIHAGYNGPITLEIINFGPQDFLLGLEMPICQLIIEEVKGYPGEAPNQFKGQSDPAGVI